MKWRRNRENDLDRDIEHFLDEETAENVARGMTPEEARPAAHRKFGNLTMVKEDTLRIWSLSPIDTWWADVRHSFRRIRHRPGTSALIVFSLALAFIPSVTLFSLMDHLFLSQLPVPHPEAIMAIQFRDIRPDSAQSYWSPSYPEVQEFRGTLRSFSGFAHHRRQGALAMFNGRRLSLWTSLINDDFFTTLGIPVRSAPGFPKDRRSVIISHSLWTREFQSRSDIAGQTLRLNGQEFLIAGVAPAAFRGADSHIQDDVWIPMETWFALQPNSRDNFGRRQDRGGALWARLREGVPEQTAIAEVQAAGAAIARNGPPETRFLQGHSYAVLKERARGGRNVATMGVLLLGILIAVACANVTGILLARAEERRRETALRQALGASRLRLIREWMIESIVLAFAGAAIGIAGARVLIDAAPGLLPAMPIPLVISVTFSSRVWVYAVTMMSLAALSFGLIPAWRGSRPGLLSALRGDDAVTLLRVRVPIRSLLIIGQVAAAELLLFGAGLLLDHLWRLQKVDAGMDPNRPVILAMVLPSGENGAPTPMNRDGISERLSRLAGVARVSYGKSIPLSGMMGAKVRMERIGAPPMEIYEGSVGPEFCSMLGVSMLAGRDLQASDRHAVLVNPALARIIDPTGRAVGAQFRVDGVAWQVAGIYRENEIGLLAAPARPRYLRLESAISSSETNFAVEFHSDPSGQFQMVREELEKAHPGIFVATMKTLKQHHESSMFAERGATKTFYGLGLAALILTGTGLHGITAALFLRRSKEFAIRMALGASPRELTALMLSGGSRLAVTGAAIGLAIALPLGMLAGSRLQGFTPWSAPAVLGSTAIVTAVALLASARPALMVWRIRPADVLRSE